MPTIRLFLEVFGRLHWLFAAGCVLLVLEGLLSVAAVLTVAPVIDLFLSADLSQSSMLTTRLTSVIRSMGLPVTLASAVGIFVAAQVLKNVAAIAVRHALVRIRFRVLRQLLLGTFEDFFRARWLFFTSSRQGVLLNTLQREMDTVGAAIGLVMLLAANVIQLGFYLMVPLLVSWKVTLVSAVAAFLLAAPFFFMGRLYYRLGRRGTATSNEISTVLQESLSLAKIILGFGHEADRGQALARAFDAHRHVAHRFHTLQAATPLAYEPLGIMVLIITVLAGRQFGVPLAEVAVMLWALRNCMPLLGQILTQRNGLAHFAPSYEQIRDLRQQARATPQPSGAEAFSGFQTRIRLDHVTFGYPGLDPVLRDVTIDIPAGRMVAIVGESGAGKSTAIDLVMGFHEPQTGCVTIDGRPLSAFDIHSYRQRIGYVPQESVLFNRSIRDNLRWAASSATDAQIQAACRQAYAAEFIERLPEGYETLVGDRGVRLSGGQCQRIALARALLRKPALLILDEATSALDTESERFIQQAIESVAKQTTVVVIAHRLSTILHADLVYVLHQGHVVEVGTYQELVAHQGQFSRMRHLQVA